jgi:hypothetical protein
VPGQRRAHAFERVGTGEYEPGIQSALGDNALAAVHEICEDADLSAKNPARQAGTPAAGRGLRQQLL